jgi:hypothetical protein
MTIQTAKVLRDVAPSRDARCQHCYGQHVTRRATKLLEFHQPRTQYNPEIRMRVPVCDEHAAPYETGE